VDGDVLFFQGDAMTAKKRRHRSREQKDAINARARARRATPEGKALQAKWDGNRDRKKRRAQQRRNAAQKRAKDWKAEYHRRRKNTPGFQERQKWYFRKHRYGLTPTLFEEMMRAQKGLCPICGCPIKDDRRTHVDHDHETNEVRGLLCARCNAGVGFVEWDGQKWLKAALSYLKRKVVKK
jgi:Recombination endonuclease VII